MKSPTHILTLTTAILATIVITMLVSPANATKRNTIETGDIGFVDVFDLVDKALLADIQAAARDQFNVESTKIIDGLKQQLTDIETKLSTMQQTDPDAAATYQQYQTISGQLNNASQQISNAYQNLIAQQIAAAYADIYAAANEIGQQEGFTFVFATRSTGELIQTDTITGITQEILARPLMTPPTGTDMTELVRIKLGYPEKAPEPIAEETAAPEADSATEPAVEPTPASEEE